MKRTSTPRTARAADTPRCLHARALAQVWGDHDGDHLTARARWMEASDTWRATLAGAGAGADAWPHHGRRFGWHRDPAEFVSVERMLAAHDLTVDDLPALAAEAREAFPQLWDRSWLPGHEHMDARDYAAHMAHMQP